MPEALVVLVVVSIAAVLVFLKARERLRTPGARRSHDGDGGGSGGDGRHSSHDASDGGGGDGGGGD